MTFLELVVFSSLVLKYRHFPVPSLSNDLSVNISAINIGVANNGPLVAIDCQYIAYSHLFTFRGRNLFQFNLLTLFNLILLAAIAAKIPRDPPKPSAPQEPEGLILAPPAEPLGVSQQPTATERPE